MQLSCSINTTTPTILYYFISLHSNHRFVVMNKKPRDYSYLDSIAFNRNEWSKLSNQEFQIMTFRHCLFYGISKNKLAIPKLFQLYDSLVSRSDQTQRLQMLTALSATIRKNHPRAIMAFMPFIQTEEDGEIIRTATRFFVNLSFLSNKEYHSAAKILIELIKNQPDDSRNAYIILGLLDQDNEKVKNLIIPLKQILTSEIKSILWNNSIDMI